MSPRGRQLVGAKFREPARSAALEAVDDDALALMAKALGHPARVRILRMLAARRECVTGDVVSELPLAQSTVSEHLRILREAGLVRSDSHGPRTVYCVNVAGVAALEAGVTSLGAYGSDLTNDCTALTSPSPEGAP